LQTLGFRVTANCMLVCRLRLSEPAAPVLL